MENAIPESTISCCITYRQNVIVTKISSVIGWYLMVMTSVIDWQIGGWCYVKIIFHQLIHGVFTLWIDWWCCVNITIHNTQLFNKLRLNTFLGIHFIGIKQFLNFITWFFYFKRLSSIIPLNPYGICLPVSPLARAARVWTRRSRTDPLCKDPPCMDPPHMDPLAYGPVACIWTRLVGEYDMVEPKIIFYNHLNCDEISSKLPNMPIFIDIALFDINMLNIEWVNFVNLEHINIRQICNLTLHYNKQNTINGPTIKWLNPYLPPSYKSIPFNDLSIKWLLLTSYNTANPLSALLILSIHLKHNYLFCNFNLHKTILQLYTFIIKLISIAIGLIFILICMTLYDYTFTNLKYHQASIQQTYHG